MTGKLCQARVHVNGMSEIWLQRSKDIPSEEQQRFSHENCYYRPNLVGIAAVGMATRPLLHKVLSDCQYDFDKLAGPDHRLWLDNFFN